MGSKRVAGTIKEMYHGVSQTTPIRRKIGEAEEQINCRCRKSEGITNRSGSKHITTFDYPVTSNKPFIQAFKQGNDRESRMVINDGVMRIFDLDGVESTVVNNTGSYLTVSDDSQNMFSTLTIDGDTSVLNYAKVMTMTDDLTSTPTSNLLIWIKRLKYGRTYTLTIDGVVSATLAVPVFASPPINADPGLSNVPQTPMDVEISGAEFATLVSAALTAVGVANLQLDDVVVGTDITENDITISSNAPASDTIVVRAEAQLLSDLPSQCTDGYRCVITGKDNEKYNDYWVKFTADTDDVATYSGTWAESTAPNIPYKIDPTTMPVLVKRQPDGSYIVDYREWADRITGDEITNSEPTFIGKTGNWLGYFQDRLVLLAGHARIMSKSNDHGNFFFDTVQRDLPTDPIDQLPAIADPTDQLWGATISTVLVTTSANAQFITGSSEAIHNRNAIFVPSTFLPCSQNAAPVASQDRLYILSNNGSKYSQLVSFEINLQTGTPKVKVLTKHVPAYIKGNVIKLTVDPANQVLIALTDDGTMYMYEYFAGSTTEDEQNAWHTWNFADTVLDITVGRGVLTLLSANEVTNQIHMHEIDLSALVSEDAFWEEPAMDMRVQLSPTRGTGPEDKWLLTFPYRISPDVMPRAMVTTPVHADIPLSLKGAGVRLTYESPNTASIDALSVISDRAACEATELICGYTFDSEYKPSMPYPRDARGDTYTAHRLLYQIMTIHCSRSGPFVVEVDYLTGTLLSKVFSPFILNSPTAALLKQPVGITANRIHIGAEQNKCQVTLKHTDTYLPWLVSHIDWTGKLVMKGARV